jgi:hypothetical protein
MPRAPKKYHYIYKTSCLITGRFYVGMHSTDNLDDGYLGSGKILRYSIAKHGRENHVKHILQFAKDRTALALLEAELVNESLLSDPLCINLKYGGAGGGFLAEANKSNGFHRAGWIGMMNAKDHSASSKLAWERHGDKFRAAAANRRGFAHAGIIAARQPEAIAKKKDTFARIGHQQGEKNSQFGTCWVTKNGRTIKIKKDKLQEYIALGFVGGRTLK